MQEAVARCRPARWPCQNSEAGDDQQAGRRSAGAGRCGRSSRPAIGADDDDHDRRGQEAHAGLRAASSPGCSACRARGRRTSPASRSSTMKATRFAPRNERERKNAKSTIGSTTRALDDREGDQPDGRDGEQPDDRGRAPAPRVALDEREHERGEADGDAWRRRGSRRGASSSRRATRAWRTASRRRRTTATGRLRKKIDCQETFSTRKPPTTGPMASARALTRRPRCRSPCRARARGKALVMIERVAGHHERGADALDGAAGDEPGLALARAR